jgi:hypothetical protein
MSPSHVPRPPTVQLCAPDPGRTLDCRAAPSIVAPPGPSCSYPSLAAGGPFLGLFVPVAWTWPTSALLDDLVDSDEGYFRGT